MKLRFDQNYTQNKRKLTIIMSGKENQTGDRSIDMLLYLLCLFFFFHSLSLARLFALFFVVSRIYVFMYFTHMKNQLGLPFKMTSRHPIDFHIIPCVLCIYSILFHLVQWLCEKKAKKAHTHQKTTTTTDENNVCDKEKRATTYSWQSNVLGRTCVCVVYKRQMRAMMWTHRVTN